MSLLPPLHFSIEKEGEGKDVDGMRDSQPALCFCCITLSQLFVNSSAVAEVVCVLARTKDNDTFFR